MDIGYVVDELGGTAAVAEFLGVVPSAVSNAKKAGRFPEAWHYRIHRECERRKVALPENFFDLMRVAS